MIGESQHIYVARILYETMEMNRGGLESNTNNDLKKQTGLEAVDHENLQLAVQLLIEKGVATGSKNGSFINLKLKTAPPPMDDWRMGLPWEKRYRHSYRRPLCQRVIGEINAIQMIDESPYALIHLPDKETHGL